MKKKRNLTPKEIEKNLHDWTPVNASEVQAATARLKRVADKMKKDAVFTARLRQDDLNQFKKIAEKKRIPYQTLLGHVIHAYVEGTLVDVEEVRKIFKRQKVG